MNAVRTRIRPGAAGPRALSAPAVQKAPQLELEYRPTGELKPSDTALRIHNRRLRRAVNASIKKLTVCRPILVDAQDVIIDGQLVWEESKALGIPTVPVICIDHLSPQELRLLRITLNKTATMAEWDLKLLKVAFEDLYELSLDTGLDIELTGFSSAEIDSILLNGGGPSSSDGIEDNEPAEDLEPDDGAAITRRGDLWIMGQQRLACANSLDAASYVALLRGELAQMVVCDGPYGVAIMGHVSGRKDAREFEYGCGKESAEEFIKFNATVMGHLVRHSIDGSIHYHFMSWHHLWELLSAGREQYTELKNILVWSKTNCARGFYRSQHELICVFKNGTAPHVCTFGIEKGARVRSNVITMAGCNSFGTTRDEDLADHPTVKPRPLIADLIRDCSTPNGIILDAYAGSGTTILAAEWTRRRARAIELDPLYVDVAVRRWEKMTGKQAVLEATGQTFAEVAAERGALSSDEEGLLDG